jgi:hypothetical protein
MAQRKYTVHPCIDETRAGDLYLKIFRFFYHELTLPKFKNSPLITDAVQSDLEWMADTIARQSAGTESRVKLMNGEYVKSIKEADYNSVKIPWWKRWFFRAKENIVKDTVEETFDKTKAVKAVITPEITESLKRITAIIKEAEETSQGSLVDALRTKQKILAAELVLADNGFDKYVEESSIIEFFKKCKKGVRIDFIRNYTTLLPKDVIELKKKADSLMIFDNYAIMHYDPTLQAFGLAKADEEAEKDYERKKDPILFGLIEGSRRLYYVADWILTDDDLTLALLEKELDSPTKRLARWNMETGIALDESMRQLSRNASELKEYDEIDMDAML